MSVTRRLLTRAGFHSGPLSRDLDRAEAWSQLAIIVIFVILVVPTTWYVAVAVGRAGAEQEQAQRADRHQVTATLQEKAPLPGGGAGSPALRTPVAAQWQTVQGALRTGVITAMPGAPAGSTVTIWTDTSGKQTPPPTKHEDTVASVIGSGFLVIIALSSILMGLRTLIHATFERRRFEQWDQEWERVGPGWSRLP